jgi:hypothetical protein
MNTRLRLAQYLRWERQRSRRGLLSSLQQHARLFGLSGYLDLLRLLNPLDKRKPPARVRAAIERRTRACWPEGAIAMRDW